MDPVLAQRLLDSVIEIDAALQPDAAHSDLESAANNIRDAVRSLLEVESVRNPNVALLISNPVTRKGPVSVRYRTGTSLVSSHHDLFVDPCLDIVVSSTGKDGNA